MICRCWLLLFFVAGWSSLDIQAFTMPSSSATAGPLAVSYPNPTLSLRVAALSSSNVDNDTPTLRSKLRRLTGFSLTALRLTLRTATGISLSAIYASTLAATGQWIRQIMKFILSLIPPWARYFIQPFLILYYAPLFILKNLARPHNEKHEAFIDGWKQAVQIADETSTYWPLHVDEEGNFRSDIPEMDIAKAIDASVDLALEETQKDSSSESF